MGIEPGWCRTAACASSVELSLQSIYLLTCLFACGMHKPQIYLSFSFSWWRGGQLISVDICTIQQKSSLCSFPVNRCSLLSRVYLFLPNPFSRQLNLDSLRTLSTVGHWVCGFRWCEVFSPVTCFSFPLSSSGNIWALICSFPTESQLGFQVVVARLPCVCSEASGNIFALLLIQYLEVGFWTYLCILFQENLPDLLTN